MSFFAYRDQHFKCKDIELFRIILNNSIVCEFLFFRFCEKTPAGQFRHVVKMPIFAQISFTWKQNSAVNYLIYVFIIKYGCRICMRPESWVTENGRCLS